MPHVPGHKSAQQLQDELFGTATPKTAQQLQDELLGTSDPQVPQQVTEQPSVAPLRRPKLTEAEFNRFREEDPEGLVRFIQERELDRAGQLRAGREPSGTIFRTLDKFVGKPVDAFTEDTFRNLTFRGALEPVEGQNFIETGAQSFRRKNIFAQLGLGLAIDPTALLARAPSATLRTAPRGGIGAFPQSLLTDRPPTFQPAQQIGGLSGGPVQGPQIPPNVGGRAAPPPEELAQLGRDIVRGEQELVEAQQASALAEAAGLDNAILNRLGNIEQAKAGDLNRLRSELTSLEGTPGAVVTGPDALSANVDIAGPASISVPVSTSSKVPETLAEEIASPVALRAPATAVQPVPAGTTTRILQPLSSEVETSLAKLIGLADEARPINRAERIAGNARRSEERTRRVGAARALETRLRAEGVSAREAGARSTALLKGELPGPVFSPLDISETEIAPLFEHVGNIDLLYFTESNTRVALEKVLSNVLPSPSEMNILRQTFGEGLVTALQGKRSRLAGAGEFAVDVFNAPRQILTAYDVSAPLRQGVVLLPGHPGEWSKSVVTMMKSLVSASAAQADDLARKSDPNWIRFTSRHNPGDSKNLFIADLVDGIGNLIRREEQFMSRLASKIPGIKQSQRAYVTFLNKLRYDTMTNIVKGWEDAGHVVTDIDLDQLALFLNRATGRGSLGEFGNKLAPVLNTTFFSPRLLASRIQLPVSLVANPSKLVRQQVAKDLTAFIGTGFTVLSLASLAGATVELNPRSSDFGKIRIGNSSIDFWGGFQSLARYGAQFALGQSKSVSGPSRGKVRDIPRITLNDWEHPVWLRFLRSKLSPSAGFVADETVFGQENFLGDPTFFNEDFERGDVLPEIGERLAPLFFQDLLDAYKDDRIKGIFKALPAGGGAGVTTFERE